MPSLSEASKNGEKVRMITTTADSVENARALIHHCEQRRPRNGQGITLADYGEFIVWVAPTTLFRKTTALEVARKMALKLMPHLLTVQDATPEAMLADLAGREPLHFDLLREADQALWKRGRNFAAQKGWILDEVLG